MPVSHGLEIGKDAVVWFPVVLVIFMYYDFLSPVSLGVNPFVLADADMSPYLHLSVGRVSTACHCNCVVFHTLFFAIDGISVAFSGVTVAVCEYIYSFRSFIGIR